MEPEARLMSAIFEEWLDTELRQEVDGLSLKEALLKQLEAVEQSMMNTGSPAFARRCKPKTKYERIIDTIRKLADDPQPRGIRKLVVVMVGGSG
jgi:hypothetical protein